MSSSDEGQKGQKSKGTKTKGMRLAEKLLPIFGPAQVGDSTRPIRPTTADEDAREQALETQLVRKVGADGTTYLEEANPS